MYCSSFINISKITFRQNIIKKAHSAKILSISFMLVLFVSVQYAGAQSLKSVIDNFSYGVKGGMNIANMLASPSHQIDSKIMVVFGGYANGKFTDKIYFQPELLISFQGGVQHTFAQGVTDNEYVTDETLTYINLPLMIQYKFSDKLYLEAGLQPGFRLSAKANYKILNDQGKVTYEDVVDTNDSRSNFDLGINLGLGYNINDKMVAGIRYNYGMTPLNTATTKVKLHHSVVQITFGYVVF